MSIYRLIYSSANTVSLAEKSLLQHLREILKTSQRNNQSLDITGFLMFEPESFLQILEGGEDAVRATYDRISRDRRHAAVTLIEAKTVPFRSFGAWSMGGCLRTPEVEGIYLRHGISGAVKPSSLTGPQVLALAVDLQAHASAQRARHAGEAAA